MNPLAAALLATVSAERLTALEFMREAECRGADPALFFPEQGRGYRRVLAPAYALCGRCPVTWECAEYAIDEHIGQGIFGGLSEADRHRRRGRPLTCAACGRPAPARSGRTSKSIRCHNCENQKEKTA